MSKKSTELERPASGGAFKRNGAKVERDDAAKTTKPKVVGGLRQDAPVIVEESPASSAGRVTTEKGDE